MSLKFCPKCGNELEPNSTFCAACGTDLRTRKDKSNVNLSTITETTPKPQITPETVQYADFWIRLLALIIDSIIIGIIGSLISLVLFIWWIPFNPLFFWEREWWTISFPFDWLIGFLYHWLLEANNDGQTVGKKALKIRTVDEKTLGLASSSNYALNNIFKSSPFLILDLIIGIIKYSGDPKYRFRIMQHVSETVVIKSG